MTLRRLSAILLSLAILIAAPGPFARAQGDSNPRPPSARLVGLRHEFQTWCNCGPVNLMMAMSYFGWPYDQTVTAAWLKPTVNDKNVSPHEMVAYVQQQTAMPELRALWRYGGDLETLRRVIAADFPVIVESGFQPEGHEWMGHYITAMAYDDESQIIGTYDSYNGSGQETDYAEFDAMWRHFNRAFVIVYPADREGDLLAVLGPLADADTAAQIALDVALDEIARDPANKWAHFNAGTSAVALGRYEDATAHYDAARALELPFRMLWYQFGPYEAYYHTGRYFDVLALADEVETITDEIEETMVWRALALAALGYGSDALPHLDHALAWNPNCTFAREVRDSLRAGTYRAPAPLQVMVPRLP